MCVNILSRAGLEILKRNQLCAPPPPLYAHGEILFTHVDFLRHSCFRARAHTAAYLYLRVYKYFILLYYKSIRTHTYQLYIIRSIGRKFTHPPPAPTRRSRRRRRRPFPHVSNLTFTRRNDFATSKTECLIVFRTIADKSISPRPRV